MPTTTIKTEIDDGPLKKFAETYQKVHDQIKEMPGEWGKADARINMTESRFQRLAALLMTQQQVMHTQTAELTKQEKAQKALEKAERDRQKNADKLLKTIKDTGSAVAKITLDMFKWIDIGALAGGIFGAWGLDKLAQNVSDTRRAALGIGVSTGDLQALKLNFQRYADVPQSLESIASTKSDLSNMWAFRALGMNNYQQMDPGQIFIQAIQKAQELAQRTHGNFVVQDPYVKALGLLGFSPDDIRRLGRLEPGELSGPKGAIARYREDRRNGMSDRENLAWQNMLVSMERFGLQLRNAFTRWFAPAVDEMPKLYDALNYFIQRIFGDSQMKKWVDELAMDIRQFADWLQSPQAKKAFDDFFGAMEKAFQKVLDWLPQFDKIIDALNIMANFITNTFGPQGGRSDAPKFSSDEAGIAFGKPNTKHWQQDLDLAKSFASKLGISNSDALGLVQNLRVEDPNLDPFAQGDFVKGKGYTAFGLAQWHKPRQDEMAKYFGWSEGFMAHMQKLKGEGKAGVTQALQEEMQFIAHEIQERSGLLAALKSTNSAGKAAYMLSKQYEGAVGASGNRETEAVRRGNLAAGLVVYINNNTGGAVHTQVALLQ